jgi:SRSO17 transposase
MAADEARSLGPNLSTFLERFRGRFKRDKTFDHWHAYVAGLLSDLKRKSIEPIALAAGRRVRTLQQVFSHSVWDHEGVTDELQQMVADEHEGGEKIAVLDACAHPKQGDSTPGVQWQWCGERGKLENCVVGQHLLLTDDDPDNPFSCVLDSDLFLPKEWDEDRPRCRAVGIPDDLSHRPRWEIGLQQLQRAGRNRIRFDWVTFDEEYGHIPAFWFGLDELGLDGMGEVRSNFLVWPDPPRFRSPRGEYAAKRADNICRLSRKFTRQSWRRLTIKESTRGPVQWEVKAARVHIVDASSRGADISRPSKRRYWLIVARNPATGEVKYFLSNASAKARLEKLLEIGFSRWHIEKWFRRGKQEAGFGAFEVQNYTSLKRHWITCMVAMYFLMQETHRIKKNIRM